MPGRAGFIGTNFIRHAIHHTPGWRIVNLDALTWAGNSPNLTDLSFTVAGRYRIVHGKIHDISLIDRLFKEEHFDAVVHFAAESHVDRSIKGPRSLLKLT